MSIMNGVSIAAARGIVAAPSVVHIEAKLNTMLGRSRLSDTSKDLLRSMKGMKGVVCFHKNDNGYKKPYVSPTSLD